MCLKLRFGIRKCGLSLFNNGTVIANILILGEVLWTLITFHPYTNIFPLVIRFKQITYNFDSLSLFLWAPVTSRKFVCPPND